jgi:hypothetical protein
VTRRRTIEQVRRHTVINDGPAKANTDWPYERAACRAPIDSACPISPDADNWQHTRVGAEKTINQGRSRPYCEGKDCQAQFPSEAAPTSEGLRRRSRSGDRTHWPDAVFIACSPTLPRLQHVQPQLPSRMDCHKTPGHIGTSSRRTIRARGGQRHKTIPLEQPRRLQRRTWKPSEFAMVRAVYRIRLLGAGDGPPAAAPVVLMARTALRLHEDRFRNRLHAGAVTRSSSCSNLSTLLSWNTHLVNANCSVSRAPQRRSSPASNAVRPTAHER